MGKQLELPGTNPEDLPYRPLKGLHLKAELRTPPECLRGKPALTWRHRGWVEHSLQLAVWCGCRKCMMVLNNLLQRVNRNGKT